jgi:hypothetical protein
MKTNINLIYYILIISIFLVLFSCIIINYFWELVISLIKETKWIKAVKRFDFAPHNVKMCWFNIALLNEIILFFHIFKNWIYTLCLIEVNSLVLERSYYGHSIIEIINFIRWCTIWIFWLSLAVLTFFYS